MEEQLNDLISRMTLEEKIALTTGRDLWSTEAIERLGIPSVWLADGPHGVRRAFSGDDIGLGGAMEATCFPTASALASSWDRELMEEVGRALGKECQALNVQILLGPGLNIKRSPLCGRNFEYFSEDPYLSGELAAAFIQGVQCEGIGTSIKHFACNEQEFERMTVSAEVDERTLRELYLSAFERAVKKSSPWTVMASYNRVNGIAVTENYYLLTEILRKEWQFDGLVVSDWSAVNYKEKALLAGLDLEMPGKSSTDEARIAQLVRDGAIPEQVIDQAARRILSVVLKAFTSKKDGAVFDIEAHHELARRAAASCFVLLKNDGNILPLDPRKLNSLAVIGRFAKEPRYQGAGSSQVSPTRLDSAYIAIQSLLGERAQILYAEGYTDDDSMEEKLIREAVEAAQAAKAAVVFAGLPPRYEEEGFDRVDINLPVSHNRLIEAVCAVQPNTIVVLSNGSAVSMPWLKLPAAVMEGWLSGQAGGSAAADLLFGRMNPSGKLSETFPCRLEDTPAYLNFPGEEGKVLYGEGLFVGYKYYDKKKNVPLFPFGFGLSYTTFAYSGLEISNNTIHDNEQLIVSLQIENTGDTAGSEVVQLYLRDENSSLIRPVKELKGFTKVALNPAEKKIVNFELSGRDFAYYDSAHRVWYVETGWFEILVGSSSADIKLSGRVFVNSSQKLITHYHKLLPVKHFLADPEARELLRRELNSSPLIAVLLDNEIDNVFIKMLYDMPIIKVLRYAGAAVREEDLDQIIAVLNRTEKALGSD